MTGSPGPYAIPEAEAPEATEAKEEPRKRSKLADAVIEIVTTVGLAVVLYLIITTFIVQTFRVEQHSMQDTLQPGQHLLIDKITPRFDTYSRGDIVVFHPNGKTDETPFIKRVIGVGGDHVEIRDGAVWVGGVRLEEDEYTYRDPFTDQNEPTERTGRQSEWDVPEGFVLVLGDHRQESTDSRSDRVGFVDVDDIVGRAWLRFFPLDALGIMDTPGYPELEDAG